MNQKEYLIALQLEQGWQIDISSCNSFPIFDNTLVFSAINKIIGKELYVEFENEEIGYTLNEVLIYRENFNFNFNENSKIYNTISSSLELDKIIEIVNKKTNPNNLDLVSLRIYGGWKILLNRLYNLPQNYSEREFLFLATKNKFLIEIIFNKETGYIVNTGKLNNNNHNNFIDYQNIELLNGNFSFNSLEDLIVFMEDFFIKPE